MENRICELDNGDLRPPVRVANYILTPSYKPLFIIDRVALAKQGDNRIGSVRPSVCPSVRLCVCGRSHG